MTALGRLKPKGFSSFHGKASTLSFSGPNPAGGVVHALDRPRDRGKLCQARTLGCQPGVTARSPRENDRQKAVERRETEYSEYFPTMAGSGFAIAGAHQISEGAPRKQIREKAWSCSPSAWVPHRVTETLVRRAVRTLATFDHAASVDGIGAIPALSVVPPRSQRDFDIGRGTCAQLWRSRWQLPRSVARTVRWRKMAAGAPIAARAVSRCFKTRPTKRSARFAPSVGRVTRFESLVAAAATWLLPGYAISRRRSRTRAAWSSVLWPRLGRFARAPDALALGRAAAYDDRDQRPSRRRPMPCAGTSLSREATRHSRLNRSASSESCARPEPWLLGRRRLRAR